MSSKTKVSGQHDPVLTPYLVTMNPEEMGCGLLSVVVLVFGSLRALVLLVSSKSPV